MMRDIIYAGFSQLAYLDWHKLNDKFRGYKLKQIFGKDIEAFDQIKTKGFKKLYEDKKDFIWEEKLTNGNNARIYNGKDERLIYLYSEDAKNPNETPKFPEFREWEFIYGYDHKKIYDELSFYTEESMIFNPNGYEYKEEKITKKDIPITDSGFEASVFKKGTDVMIAYRGTAGFTDIKTDLTAVIDMAPYQFSCAIWLYNKVIYEIRNGIVEKTKKPSPLKGAGALHITGHSLGGALAQFAGIYAGGIHRTVTWNGYGLGKNGNFGTGDKVLKKYIDVVNRNFPAMKNAYNLINFNISKDPVGNKEEKRGITYIVDKKDSPMMERQWNEDFSLLPFHSIVYFLPFFDNEGNIFKEIKDKTHIGKLNENFIKNSYKAGYRRFPQYFPAIPKLPKKAELGEEYCSKICSKYNDENIFWYALESNIKKEDKNWYTENPLEVGLFNNLHKIGGVSGGKPMKLEIKLPDTAKTALVIDLKTGSNLYVKSRGSYAP